MTLWILAAFAAPDGVFHGDRLLDGVEGASCTVAGRNYPARAPTPVDLQTGIPWFPGRTSRRSIRLQWTGTEGIPRFLPLERTRYGVHTYLYAARYIVFARCGPPPLTRDAWARAIDRGPRRVRTIRRQLYGLWLLHDAPTQENGLLVHACLSAGRCRPMVERLSAWSATGG